MKTTVRTFFLAVATVFFSCALVRPVSAQDQPRMKEAVELLKRAQDSRDPVPLLRAAKKELRAAEHDKGGFRIEAIRTVDDAIAEAEAGRPVKMQERVAAAITEIPRRHGPGPLMPRTPRPAGHGARRAGERRAYSPSFSNASGFLRKAARATPLSSFM